MGIERETAAITLNTRLLPILVGVLLLLQLTVPYRGWLLLLVGLGSVWALSYLWARSLARTLRLTRQMRYGWSQVGDRLEERFTLTNAGWAPGLWVEVVDHTDMPDYNTGRVTGVGATDATTWRTSGVCTHRGIYTLGPTSVRTGDPFSLYTVTIEFPESRQLMVAPPVVILPEIDVAPAGRTGEGPPRSRAVQPTISASTVREYAPGDSMRWIHWRTTARRNDLYVRLFDETPASDWWIFLDMEAAVQAGTGEDSTEEHGVILAASLADRGLRADRTVGFVSYGTDLVWMPADAGEQQRLRILRELAVIEPGQQSLAQLLERSRQSLSKHTSIIIITPSLDARWVESLLLMQRRGARPTVLLLDPQSFGGEGDAGAVQALLASQGITCHIITRDLLDRPEARPGQLGQWEWRTLATGRVITVRGPEDMSWESL